MKRNSKSYKAQTKKSVKNTSVHNSMFGQLFDPYAGSNFSALSYPGQLGFDAQYNPITLNRMLLSYSYMTFGIIQTFIDQPVEDAFRGGVKILCDELEEDDLDLLQDTLLECGDYDAMKNTMKWAKLYGGAGLIINTAQDPKEELDMENLDENSPLSFIDADRWELTLSYMLEDKVPCPYNYYGQPIHRTRVVKVLGKEAPSFVRRRLQGWGMSELERVVRDVNSYAKNQDVIYELLDEAKIDIWQIEGLNAKLLSSNSQSQLMQRLNLATRLKNYQRALIMDKNDLYEQKQISFGGLAEMQNQNRIGVAASVRMPLTKLFGLSTTGFNEGEADLENYNSLIESEVRSKARPLIHTVIKLRCQQLFGFIPEYFNVEFTPLRILSSEQMENVKAQKFQRASALYAQGMLTGKEYAELLKKEDIVLMETEVTKGLREPEPPQAPSLDIDLPQKVVKTKAQA